jgi:TP901 family phage tail tape measure protein
MTQGALSVKVGGDFSELFNGFKQLPAEAAKAGQGMETGLNQPIQESRKSLGQLMTDLRALRAAQAKLPLDSSEYKAAGLEITKIKQQIGDLSRQRTKIPVDSSEVKEAGNQFRLLDGVIGGIAFSLTNTLTNAAGTALQAISSIPRTVSQFDTARAAVATLGVDTAALSGNFVGLSKELNNNVSQVELLQAAYDVASSGFADAASNTEVMRAAALLATGGFTDLQTAGDGLTSVLNAYGLSAADATKVTDMIIQTQNDGKIVAGEYAQQIGRLAPTAVASGVALEELNAAISSATAQGVPVGSTFSGIQQAIVSILKPSQDAAKYAAELGIEWNAAALQAKGFGGFLQQLVDKGAASSESIIRLTGSTEAQSALMPLLNDGLEKYNENLERQKNSAGVAADASEKATATIDGSLKRLGNTFSNLTVEVFSGLAPIVAGAINAVTGFVEAILGIPGPLKVAARLLIGLPATYIAVTLAVAGLNTAMGATPWVRTMQAVTELTNLLRSRFLADVAAAKGAWVAFSASIQTGALQGQIVALTAKFGPLALAIASVTAAVISYNKSTEDSQSIAQSAAAGQEQLTAALVAAGIQTQELTTLGGPFARALQGGVDVVEALLAPLRAIPGIGPQVADAVRKIGETVVNIIPGLKGAAEAIGFLVNGFRDSLNNANITQGLENAAIALGNLQAQSGLAQSAAGELFATLKEGGGPPNTEQTEEIQKLVAALEVAKTQAGGLAEKYTLLAAAARNSGNDEYAEDLERLAEAARGDIKLSEARIAQLESLIPATERKAAATAKDAEATKKVEEAVKARAAAEAELNTIISEAPVRNLEAQLAVGQQLVGLAKAVAEQEQSRFGAIKAGIEFELSKAEERGASEKEISDLKRAIDKLDRDAAEARFRALTQQQELEIKMLELAQQKATLEADLSVQQARVELLRAEDQLRKATTAEAKGAAQAEINLQQEILGIREQGKALLGTIQPLEQAILATQQDAAKNAERAKAAQEGYKIAADGSLESLKRVTQEVVVSSERQADGTIVLRQRYQEVAQAAKVVTGAADATTLAISRAADGSIVLTQRQAGVAGASAAADRAISSMANKLGVGATNAGKAADGSKSISDSLKNAASPANGLAEAFAKTGDKAPAIEQGARNFAGWLSSAKGFAERIAGLNLDRQMENVARSTQAAASAAQQFYTWLERASRLPGSRWTGGPVEAGEAYKINELGQEALLSHGRLSLINAPANSTWRAPADGTVIPAGITARLQDQGVLPGGGGAMAITTGTMSNAALAIEVGKLRQEVGELARKSWNVGVTMKTGPTGSQVMRQMLR